MGNNWPQLLASGICQYTQRKARQEPFPGRIWSRPIRKNRTP